MTQDTEVRITSRTGGQKGKKAAQIGALDPKALLALAKVAGEGAEKYSRQNFLKGYDWSLSFDSAQRHLLDFWDGQDVDPESGNLNVLHAAWHCLALASFLLRDLGDDDRFKQDVPEVITESPVFVSDGDLCAVIEQEGAVFSVAACQEVFGAKCKDWHVANVDPADFGPAEPLDVFVAVDDVSDVIDRLEENGWYDTPVVRVYPFSGVADVGFVRMRDEAVQCFGDFERVSA